MPYINEERKAQLAWGDVVPDNAGDINYMVTKLCDEYLERKGLRYEHINAIVGALECCKLELYRRVAAPYENQKIRENGDAYRAELVSQADPNDSVATPASVHDVALAVIGGRQAAGSED